MSNAGFHALIDQICAKCGIANSASMHRAPHFTFKDVTFTLGDGAAIVPDSVIVYTDLGELPRQSREAVLLRLLELNALFTGPASPVYCYNPENRHVLLMSAMDLRKASADKMIERFEVLVPTVADWRNNHFLGSEEKTASAPTASTMAPARIHSRFAARFERGTALGGQPK